MKFLASVKETSERITSGKRLLLAGDETVLKQLPKGDWIGGTIPYFMSENGGEKVKDRIHVVVLTGDIIDFEIKFYDEFEIPKLPQDYKSNSVSFIIIPAFSPVLQIFAKDCSTWKGLFERPLIGWVSGFDLSAKGEVAKVFNGATGEVSHTKAVVLHANLHKNKLAKVNIINLFKPSEGDTIQFTETGFEIHDCIINGKKVSFSSYITENKINTQLPIVASYYGSNINVSVKEVFNDKVVLYAPVFENIDYHFASPIGDYEKAFLKDINATHSTPLFSCNCVLNYLYANLEGKKTGEFVGPMTFGEIAYMLLNQTFVCVTIEDR